MNVRQLGNGMAHRFIQAAGDVAALDVGDGDAQVVGGDAGGKDLAPGADNQQDVGRQIGQNVDRLGQADPDGAATVGIAIALLAHVDGGIDAEAALDFLDRAAEAVVEMLIGDDDFEFHVVMVGDQVHGRCHGAETAALSRPDTDAALKPPQAAPDRSPRQWRRQRPGGGPAIRPPGSAEPRRRAVWPRDRSRPARDQPAGRAPPPWI